MTQSEKLRVSRILHKAAVTVDENGTEAAASTFIDLVPLSITSPIKNVIVNKPFLFILQDSHYRIPLIMGRVVNPSISKWTKHKFLCPFYIIFFKDISIIKTLYKYILLFSFINLKNNFIVFDSCFWNAAYARKDLSKSIHPFKDHLMKF